MHPIRGSGAVDFIRDGSDTPKLVSAWLDGGRERERVDELPLAHARSHSGGLGYFPMVPPAESRGLQSWRRPFPWRLACVVAGQQHVDGGHHKQGEQRPDRHAADEHQADRVARGRAGARHQGSAGSGRPRWRRWSSGWAADASSPLVHGFELRLALFLELVGELHDQDAVLAMSPRG